MWTDRLIAALVSVAAATACERTPDPHQLIDNLEARGDVDSLIAFVMSRSGEEIGSTHPPGEIVTWTPDARATVAIERLLEEDEDALGAFEAALVTRRDAAEDLNQRLAAANAINLITSEAEGRLARSLFARAVEALEIDADSDWPRLPPVDGPDMAALEPGAQADAIVTAVRDEESGALRLTGKDPDLYGYSHREIDTFGAAVSTLGFAATYRQVVGQYYPCDGDAYQRVTLVYRIDLDSGARAATRLEGGPPPSAVNASDAEACEGTGPPPDISPYLRTRNPAD